MEAERVLALEALCSLWSKNKLSVEIREEMDVISNKEKEEWIEGYVERETAFAKKQVQDAERVIVQEQKDMTTDESAGATTTNQETMYEEMLNAIGDSLSDLECSDDEQDWEDKEDNEENSELGKLSDNDEHGWVMGTISETLQHRMESFWQKQLRLDKLRQVWWGDPAIYVRQRDMNYGNSELKVPAVAKFQIDMTAAIPSPTTFGEHMQTVDIVRGQLQMPAVTSWLGCS